MDPKVNEKHEEHEDSKKEEPEQPVIVSRITRLPVWYELIKSNQAEELKVVIKNECMEDLWMKALRDLEPDVLPDGWRRLWWLLVPVHQTYHYMSHYIICNIHELDFYIKWMQRMFSREIE